MIFGSEIEMFTDEEVKELVVMFSSKYNEGKKEEYFKMVCELLEHLQIRN